MESGRKLPRLRRSAWWCASGKAINLGVTIAEFYLAQISLLWAGVLSLVTFVLVLILTLDWGHLTLRLTLGKSAGLGLAWLLSVFLVSVGCVLLLLRFYVCEAFIIPIRAPWRKRSPMVTSAW